jgi:hypothetical protein
MSDAERGSLELLWERVDEIVDRAPDLDSLRLHGLHMLALRRWRESGRDIPETLEAEERLFMALQVTAPMVLRAARDAFDGRIAIMKGPEVAHLYRDPGDRGYGDLDLLVDDAGEAQRAFIAAGFVEVGEPEVYRDIHHLRPLALPPCLLSIELHHAPKWPTELSAPPPRAELLEAAVPSATGISGLDALHPDHHAICLAAHSWAHEPFLRLRDLVDVAVVTASGSGTMMDEIAIAWGVQKLWRTTTRTCAALFDDGPMPMHARIWARHLETARQRTVFEWHLTKWVSPYADRRPPAAVRASLAAAAQDLRPTSDETWNAKIKRTLVAVRNAHVPRLAHDDELGDAAHAGNEVRARIAARENAP